MEPQKTPLILLTDRPVQVETPRHYFRTVFTPNEAFYVRWHLGEIPNSVDLAKWKLRVEGNVNKRVAFSLSDVMQKFKPVSVAAVNQCSGKQPEPAAAARPGRTVGKWGNGKRDVDRRATPRASGRGGRQKRLGTGTV